MSEIEYANTDLELESPVDIRPLTAELEARNMMTINDPRLDGKVWRVRLITVGSSNNPEESISAMVASIESIPKSMKANWSKCTVREFDIGYHVGTKPWAFNQAVSHELLARMVALGGSLRITIYPPPTKVIRAR